MRCFQKGFLYPESISDDNYVFLDGDVKQVSEALTCTKCSVEEREVKTLSFSFSFSPLPRHTLRIPSFAKLQYAEEGLVQMPLAIQLVPLQYVFQLFLC